MQQGVRPLSQGVVGHALARLQGAGAGDGGRQSHRRSCQCRPQQGLRLQQRRLSSDSVSWEAAGRRLACGRQSPAGKCGAGSCAFRAAEHAAQGGPGLGLGTWEDAQRCSMRQAGGRNWVSDALKTMAADRSTAGCCRDRAVINCGACIGRQDEECTRHPLPRHVAARRNRPLAT